jgi:hypothetical protein
MGGTAGKTLLTLALAALLALGLAACGGGGDSTQSTATATAGGEATTPPSNGDAKPGSEKQAGGSKGGGGKESGGSATTGGSGKDEGSASFRTRGGDNSIQNFGDEAGTSERDARAKGDWGGSCKYLATAAVKPLEQLAASSPQLKGKGCAAIIGALSTQLPASSRANPVGQGVASLRVEGEQGFALFHGPKGVNYFVPMVKEGDGWKVGALAPSEFP